MSSHVKIIGVPSEITCVSLEDSGKRLPCQEFQGLVLPTITSNGEQKGSYIVRFLEAIPHINIHRPILAEWLEGHIPQDNWANACLIFKAEICLEVSSDEPTTIFV